MSKLKDQTQFLAATIEAQLNLLYLKFFEAWKSDNPDSVGDLYLIARKIQKLKAKIKTDEETKP